MGAKNTITTEKQVIDKFYASFYVDPVSKCWVWNRSLGSSGYSNFYDPIILKKHTLGHRFSFHILKGKLEENLQIDHLCKNRKCVNPEHLEQVSIRENMIRSESFTSKNVRKTHCPAGHEYNAENLGKKKNPRYCKKCKAIKTSLWRARKVYENRKQQHPVEPGK